MLVEWIMLVTMIVFFGIIFIGYKEQKRLMQDMAEIRKSLEEQAAYKLEPAPKEEQEPEHELQAEMEVDEDTYNRMMAEWMGITLENPKQKEGDVIGE